MTKIQRVSPEIVMDTPSMSGAQLRMVKKDAYLIKLDLRVLHPHIIGQYRSRDDTWALGDIDTLDIKSPIKSDTIRINGTFFRDVKNLRAGELSRLAFPVWQDSHKSGYDGRDEGYGLRYLSWSADTGAKIETSYPSQSGSSLIITGLDPLCDKDGIGSRHVGRTYLGLVDAHTLLILVAEHMSESEAQNTLKKYSSKDEIMLDGGPSSSLTYNGKIYIQNANPIAHAIEWRRVIPD